MAQSFTSAYITKDGMNMLLRAQAGSLELSFTKAVIGNGTYQESEKTIEVMESMTSLKNPLYEFSFAGKEIINSTSLMLKVTISNENVTDDFNYNEIGIYASNRKTGEEHLYAVAIVKGDQGDIVPEYDGHNLITIKQKIYLTVSNTANITLNVSGTYVTIDEFEEHTEDTNAHGIQDLINGLFGFKYFKSLKGAINYIGSFFDLDKKTVVIPEALVVDYTESDKTLSLVEGNITIGISGGSSGGGGGGTYSLPPATRMSLGGVMIGDGLNVTSAGKTSVDASMVADLVAPEVITDVSTDAAKISQADIQNLFN